MTLNATKTRQEVEALLGSSIQDATFPPPSVLKQTADGAWTTERLSFTAADGEQIPAVFHHPANTEEPVPAVLYCHAHGNRHDFGADELLEGRPTLQGTYVQDLQALGIASLCLEMPAFGARQIPSESARAKKHLWNGTTLFGQMLDELAAGVQFLVDHPAIDANRLGAMGFSMGSTQAFWMAALDERIKAAVALCSFADLACLTETPAHDGHGIYMTVPGLLKKHSTAAIAGLAAPRALMVGVGLQDWSTPERCFSKARAELEDAYRDCPDRLHFHVEPDAAHEETPAMRQAALSFLQTHLMDG